MDHVWITFKLLSTHKLVIYTACGGTSTLEKVDPVFTLIYIYEERMLQVANNARAERAGFLVNRSKDWQIMNYIVQICNNIHHWYALCVWAPTVKDIQAYMLYAIDTIFFRNSHKDIVFPIYACDSLKGIIANANTGCRCGSETEQWFIMMRSLSRVMLKRCRGCNRKGGK